MIEKETPLFDPGGGMVACGIILFIAGLVAAILAFGMDTSIPIDDLPSALPYSSSYSATKVVNASLQQKQMIIFVASLTAILAGVIIASIGRACSLLQRSAK
jgi:hypothetical protein